MKKVNLEDRLHLEIEENLEFLKGIFKFDILILI